MLEDCDLFDYIPLNPFLLSYDIAITQWTCLPVEMFQSRFSEYSTTFQVFVAPLYLESVAVESPNFK